MESRNEKMTTVLTRTTAGMVRDYAFRKDLTYSSAMSELIELGLAQTGSIELLEKFISDNNSDLIEGLGKSIGKQIKRLQKQVDRNTESLSSFTNNDQYGDRASLAVLAWASWITKYFFFMMTPQGVEDCKEDIRREAAKAMFDLGVVKTHEVFWDAGGELSREPEDIIGSLYRMGDIVGDEAMVKLTGMTSNEWKYRFFCDS